ncbi:MAG: AAA family ATPase [Sulfuricella sp.]
MFLKSVSIQHYKSLAEVEIADLKPLTLLVGTNAVGKSNIVDALKFIRDIAVDGLDHAMSTRGGIGIIRQYSPTRPFQISIKVNFIQLFDNEEQHDGSYEITISSLKGGNYRVEHEAATWWDEHPNFNEDDEWVRDDIFQSSFSRNVSGELRFDGDSNENPVPQDVAVLGSRTYHIRLISSFFSRFRFSTIFPNTLREPSRPDTDRALKESGQNWASVLKALKKTTAGRLSLERIKETMQVVMPALRDVAVKSVGGYLVPQFRVQDNDDSNAHDFDPVQLSDGTLRIFGILLALYQTPPPPFLALEEPEQTVHPAILATLAEAFREVSEHTQIFVTSHSPHFVDFFQPEEIRVVSMEKGKTLVSPIRRAQMESIKERLISLEELMMSEGLQPEIV